MKAIKIAVIDDEINPLKTFVETVIDKAGIQCSYFMKNPNELLSSAEREQYDAVFLDINMPIINGVDLAERLINLLPDVKIVFISGYTQNEQVIRERIGKNLIGFCYKPYSGERVEEFLANIKKAQNPKQTIYAKTFGSFDIYINDEKIEFDSQKSKEFLAYLVNRQGATVLMGEMITALWPDKSIDKAKLLYRNAKCRLDMLLRKLKLTCLVKFGRAKAAINVSCMSCDMWDYINDINNASYTGEYMINYNWSVGTQHYLDNIALQRK